MHRFVKLVILVLASVSLIHSATLPSQAGTLLSVKPSTTTLADQNSPLSALKFNQTLPLPNSVTLHLVAHHCLLHVVRIPTLRLPDPAYRITLLSALDNVSRLKSLVGDMFILSRHLRIIEGEVVFTADNLGREPGESLTVGTVEEALRVLLAYFPEYPYDSMIWVSQGRDEETPGRVIGKMSLWFNPVGPRASQSDRQTS